MEYLSVKEIAKKWGMSERTIRNYCANGLIEGVFQTGKTWNIPANSLRPKEKKEMETIENQLHQALRKEKEGNVKGGIYHKTQIILTYNSNHIEGSRLSEDQTRYIFETNTIGVEGESINVDDVIETANHFRCIDYIIDNANLEISEEMIKHLHYILKVGTSDSRKDWFNVGDYKKLPNEVGGLETTKPEDVKSAVMKLLEKYNNRSRKTIEEIISFHKEFESIHPFQDGNGRVGRLIMFKECLANNVVPFIITDELKYFYYRGLKEWDNETGYLLDTCLTAQDQYKKYLDYFNIKY